MFSLEPGFLLQNHLKKKVVLLKYLKCSNLLIYSTNQNHISGYLNDFTTHKPSYVSRHSFISFSLLGWRGTKSTTTEATTGLLYQPQKMMDDECGAIGGENGSAWRKSATVPLCSPQIPHDLTRTQTRAATVGSRQLTT
jgi:hypothetical protein